MINTSDHWPVAAAMLQFPAIRRGGVRVQEADASLWASDFAEIRRTGFELVEINDNWVRIGDLSAVRLDEMTAAAAKADLTPVSLAIVRSSIIDPADGADNLAYTHRSLDAAAALGLGTVSIGFHRPLTDEQRHRLWFWTAPGPADDPQDTDNWVRAVRRVRELGRHAAQLGLLLSLEMYEDTYLGTAESAVRLVTEVGLDNVGLNPDVGNLVRLHRPIEDPAETLAATLPYANYWHVKNYLRDEDPDAGVITTMPAPLELGIINYRHAVADALSVGFRGVLVCEHYGGDGLGVSARNQEYLRSLLPDGGAA